MNDEIMNLLRKITEESDKTSKLLEAYKNKEADDQYYLLRGELNGLHKAFQILSKGG